MNENSNRAFMYGESVFTTMRMIDGVVLDWEYHFDRLKKGAEFLYGPFTDEDWELLLKNRLESRYENEQGDKVLRLTLYRDQKRGLQPVSILSVTDIKVHLNATPFDPKRVEGKIKLRTCPALPRPYWWPSFLKAGSYLETILSQKRFLQPGDDDLLFLSRDDTVLESSVANIFIVRNKKLYTAPVGPNVLDGVMRRKVIEVACDYFDDFIESESTMDQLMKAEGVFGTNSVRGLFLVDRIDDYEIIYHQDFLDRFDTMRRKVIA